MTARTYTDPAAVSALEAARNAVTLTPDQQQQIRDCTGLITRARAGYVPDCIIRAGLMAEGWAAGAVIGAFEALERKQRRAEAVEELSRLAQEMDAAPAQEVGA